MPQISLEYTSNIDQEVPTAELTAGLHKLVAGAVEDLDIENCKSRVIVRDEFCVGTGGESKGFIHADVGILSGRSPETKRELGEKLVAYLQRCFANSVKNLDVQITVEIRDMDRDAYFKASGKRIQNDKT